MKNSVFYFREEEPVCVRESGVCDSVFCIPLTCVCQTKSPESEVRGGVGDAAQAVLYGVDGLMH